jgi:hypothetical protein
MNVPGSLHQVSRRAPVSGSIGKPFGGGESMGMTFPRESWVKSLPRGPSVSVLRRRDGKLSQEETCDYDDEELSSISYRRFNQ